MNRILKRWQWRWYTTHKLGLFLGLLLGATAMVLALIVRDLIVQLQTTGSWWGAVQESWTPGHDTRTLLSSRLFQILVALVGWSAWFAARRRRQDQLRLRRSEQRYRSIINHAGEAIFLLDAAGRVLEWNKAAEILFGEARRNVLGRPFRDIHLCYGLRIDAAMSDADRLKRSLTFEFPFPRRSLPGGQISLTISPIATAEMEGERPGRAYVVIARDITSEKQLAVKMSETEKLAGIGQLAAGIAHQLNTPLGSILLSAQMLEETIKGEDEAEDVRRIIRQTDQCRTIIKGLLNFARPTGRERTELRLGGVVRDTVYLLEKNIKVAGIEVVIQEKDEAIIQGNRNELEQVIFNLLSNSLDAMPRGGEIEITLGAGEPGEVLVVFEDHGEGISAQHRDQVFLPFFTTKEYGKGTGLGLSIVARIVHEHGGRIEMESVEGEGTKFYLTFPQPGFSLVREEVPGREE
jgi:PAS domain S-box-containing protein